MFAPTTGLDAPGPDTDKGQTAPAPALEEPEYTAAVDQLRVADEAANRDPVAAATALSDAISALEQFGPALAADAEARELRQFARLDLARAHLLANQPELAAQVMDEAIREAMGDPIPAGDFGPSLGELYEQRLAALEESGRASLVVNCGMECKVYVNERDLGPNPPPLLLGTYRVWIEDTTGKRTDTREQVELGEAGQVLELEFAVLRPPPQPAPQPPAASFERKMPRWAEISLIIAGVGLTTTGGVLLGLDGTHKRSGAQHNTLPGGAVATLVGVVTLLPGVITLSIDERRLAGKTRRQATVNWTMRF
ncbi:hypothetical protein DB30_01345 [Enhygromyxa salina]|uniref:PEGA domain-containing protein n=1 Tax=Enhygromyxa salina TaxID=215803 RepID=A0A0C2D505_9BACT|nr:hypothetical protein DB30_01345 [Enhygromyxa salina]